MQEITEHWRRAQKIDPPDFEAACDEVPQWLWARWSRYLVRAPVGKSVDPVVLGSVHPGDLRIAAYPRPDTEATPFATCVVRLPRGMRLHPVDVSRLFAGLPGWGRRWRIDMRLGEALDIRCARCREIAYRAPRGMWFVPGLRCSGDATGHEIESFEGGIDVGACA